METGKEQSKLSQKGRDVEEGKSPEPEGAGGDRTELLSKFAQEGIALLKQETEKGRKREEISPGQKKALRGILEKHLSEWRKNKEDQIP